MKTGISSSGHRRDVHAPSDGWRLENEHPERRYGRRQSDPDTPVQPGGAADADVPSDLVRVLSVLFRMVRHRAADGRGPGGPAAVQGTDRQYHHRVGGHYHRGPPGLRVALRPHRPPAGLQRPAGARVNPGDVHWTGPELRDVSAVPPGDWGDWRVLRDHPVPHLGDVRAQRGGDGQRHHRRLGQHGRRRHSDGNAAGLRRRADVRRRGTVGMADRDGDPGRGPDAGGGGLLLLHPGLPAGELP